MSEKPRPNWEGDVLSRHAIGDFLYKLVLQKYDTYHAAVNSGALCFALDADWGAGKSFFVERWSRDVEQAGHPIIHFDAWINDLADDPLLGFMAQLQNGLEPLLKKLPPTKKIRDTASRKLKAMVKNAGKAVLPVTTVVGKSVIKKLSGIDVDGVGEALNESLTSDAKAIAGEALNEFFAQALKSHSEKREAIAALKTSLSDLLAYLAAQQNVRLPLFIFIDELDRCRPDYAIRLLEGVKHLFDAQGACFVFSTNLSQLSASAKAVYGDQFDADRYLKRFFSFQFLLPAPDHKAYAAMLFKASLFEKKTFSVCSILPEEDHKLERLDVLITEFALVAESFNLDLRSQKQVFRQAEAVISAIPQGESVFPFYLFFLIAVLHRSVEAFDKLTASDSIDNELISSLGTKNVYVNYRTYTEEGRESNHRQPVVGLFWKLQVASHKPLAEQQRQGSGAYPDAILNPIVNEARNAGAVSRRVLPKIARYRTWVRTAGNLS
jgi:hypothetical protein